MASFVTKSTKSRSFSVTETTLKQLDEIREEFGLLNLSDALRRAVSESHQKLKPAYLYKRSGADILKRLAASEQEKIVDLSDEEYATEYLPGSIFVENKIGNRFVLIHAMTQNYLEALPLLTIKEWVQDNPEAVSNHKNTVASVSIRESLTMYMVNYLYKYFNITRYPKELDNVEAVARLGEKLALRDAGNLGVAPSKKDDSDVSLVG